MKNFETLVSQHAEEDAKNEDENDTPGLKEETLQPDVQRSETTNAGLLCVEGLSLDQTLYNEAAHLASLGSVDEFLDSQGILLATQEFADLGLGAEHQAAFTLWNWFSAIDNDLMLEGISNFVVLGLDFSLQKTSFLLRICTNNFFANNP